MVVGIWTKTNLFNDRFDRIRLDFLFLLLLFVQVFAVIRNATNWRFGVLGNHNQI
jgi:hypothetical protein